MKRILRLFVIETYVLYIVWSFTDGLEFVNSFEGILITGVALTIASYLIRPVVNLLILPLTIATLGIFRFIASAITLYIVDLALMEFKVAQFSYSGLTSNYIDLPAVHFPEGPLAYIAFSLLISIITTFIHWLVK